MPGGERLGVNSTGRWRGSVRALSARLTSQLSKAQIRLKARGIDGGFGVSGGGALVPKQATISYNWRLRRQYDSGELHSIINQEVLNRFDDGVADFFGDIVNTGIDPLQSALKSGSKAGAKQLFGPKGPGQRFTFGFGAMLALIFAIALLNAVK